MTESDPHIPQTISWNLTRLCNLDCGHCYLDAGARKGFTLDELSTQECQEIVDQIHQVNDETLVILTGGEPLLRADLESLCAYASEKGLWVVVGTNGTMLTSARAGGLRDAGVKGIGISIDSLRPATHDEFRGRKGAWQGAVAGLDAARLAGLDTIVQVTVNSWNVDEIARLVEFAHDRGCRAINFYFLVCTGRGQRQSELTPQAAETVYAQLHALQREYEGRLLVIAKCAPQFQRYIHQQDPLSAHLHTFQGGCPAARQYCRIDPVGNLTACPFIPDAAGNLRDQSLATLWRDSPAFNSLRGEDALGGRCGVCEYRGLCGGCRARALANGGGLLGEDAFCVYEPGSSESGSVDLPAGATYFEAPSAASALVWEIDAMQALQRIPPFVRNMVQTRLEKLARGQGATRVTRAMMQALRPKHIPIPRNALRRPASEQ